MTVQSKNILEQQGNERLISTLTLRISLTLRLISTLPFSQTFYYMCLKANQNIERLGIKAYFLMLQVHSPYQNKDLLAQLMMSDA